MCVEDQVHLSRHSHHHATSFHDTRRYTVASVSPKRVHVFISYAHADQEIAKALRQELIEVNRERVDCFMDSESIPKGEKFEPIISKQIRRADWLIVVFTGEQSEYCGFEIGMFVQMRTGSRKKNSKLVCLHDTHEIPTLPCRTWDGQKRTSIWIPR